MSEWITDLEILQFVGICVLIALFIFKNYVTPYLRKKGENLATKQDIAEITDEIERVRSEYARSLEDISQQNRLLLEQAKRKHQLSIAALDRRLEAHQQAYSLWWKLSFKIFDKDIADMVLECQDWWVKNCIYLDAESRQAFRIAYDAAFRHRRLVDRYRGTSDGSDKIEENYDTIKNAGDKIVKGVELPSLGEDEYKPVDPTDAGEA